MYNQTLLELLCVVVTQQSYKKRTYTRIQQIEYCDGMFLQVSFANDPVDNTLYRVHIFQSGEIHEYEL